MNDRDNSGL